jgi:2-oxoglutarate dehydrogenase E2 component (dihydrolipoamide succinyltransferase)
MPEADSLLAVPVPHMGVSVEEATVVAWHKVVGDEVRAGEALCDVSTDKVDTEIASPADGVLARIVAAVGETVAVGATLAEVAVGGGETTPASSEPVPRETEPTAPPVSEPGRFDPAAAARAALDRGANGNARPISSPLARRVARDHGVELAGLAGSGLRGRIRKADVLAAIEAGRSAPAAASPGGAAALPRGYDDVPREVIATSRQRQLIAEHMIRSRQTAAHMTTEAEVDMTRAAQAREQLNASRTAGGSAKLTFLALIAKATCAALLEFPDLNATFQVQRLIRWSEINLGIAVDTEQGLIVPVIRRSERLTAPAIADAIGDLAARARARKLTPEDMRGGTFTISNPGSIGAYSAMAIINQPQVAILGTPVIVRRPAVVVDEHGNETIGIRPIMALALTFDHRAVDGAYATRCIVRIKALLESWDASAYT